MVSKEYIDHLLMKYATSRKGKAHIKETTGYDYDPKMTKQRMKGYGEQMKRILFANIKPVIKSIEESDIIVGEPTEKDGKMQIRISFDEDKLHRDSLCENSEGIANIVLLFTKGYHAKARVHGTWKKRTGDVVIWSKKDRDPNNFLQLAVNEFNEYMGGIATAELDKRYVSKNDG